MVVEETAIEEPEGLGVDGRDIIISVPQGGIVLADFDSPSRSGRHDVWDGIIGDEEFVGNETGGTYMLTLRKTVYWQDEVETVEVELLDAIRLLSRAWSFAGGAVLGPPSGLYCERDLPEYTSNAAQIDLPWRGPRRVTVTHSPPFGWSTLLHAA